MGLFVTAPFERGGPFPIDEMTVLTKAQMVAVNDAVMPPVYLCVCEDDGKIYVYNKTNPADPETGKYKAHEGGGLPYAEVTQAEYNALTPEQKAGVCFFITDAGGGGGGGDQWVVLSKDLVISANELRAIENSKKPIMWFDGYYYTPITSMDTNVEWGSGYVQYFYNNYRYSIYFSYDGDDWDQPVTWGAPYSSQSGASLSAINQNGGVQVSQNISGKTVSMWLYPDWAIPNFVNSRLIMTSRTKSDELMTRYSQPQNIMKTGRVQVDIGAANKFDTVNVDISELNFEQGNDYMVITTLERSSDVAENIQHTVSGKTYSGFNINARNASGAPIEGSVYVNYMVLANRYFELYATSTAITNSTASGDKYTWAKITTDKTAYNDFSVLKSGPANARLRAYILNSSTPYLAQYDADGTEQQDAEYFYYPIKWANVDGSAGSPFDDFKYLVRSRRGGQDYNLWLASTPSVDALDTYSCPAIDRVTIVREK